jgi:UDPglucose 6-dehydrogenase
VSQKVTVVGTGYVGLVTGACLADLGHHVVCLDIDASRVALLQSGQIPIYEPGLEDIVIRAMAAGRLAFTTDVAAATEHGDYQMIAVGTPQSEDGAANVSYVYTAARNIGEHVTRPVVVIDKSTVPVGTGDQVHELIAAELERRGVDVEVSVVSNPEFLKEGAAIDDLMNPDRIVVGVIARAHVFDFVGVEVPEVFVVNFGIELERGLSAPHLK